MEENRENVSPCFRTLLSTNRPPSLVENEHKSQKKNCPGKIEWTMNVGERPAPPAGRLLERGVPTASSPYEDAMSSPAWPSAADRPRLSPASPHDHERQ